LHCCNVGWCAVAELSAPCAITVPRGSGRLALRTLVIAYVGVIVLVPVCVLVWRAFKPGLGPFFDAITDPAAVSAFRRTGVVAGSAVVLDAAFGIAVSLLLARYRFFGRRFLDTLIDLPMAISPIVVGLALVLVYGSGGWFGLRPNQVIGSTPGLILATVFVSLPLVVRSLLPVLQEAGVEQEQAAASLGAGWLATFRRVTLPTIRTALGYGVVLSLARCIGEFGAVLVVSGGFQSSETAPLRVSNLLQIDLQPDQAYAIAFVLMLVSVLAILTSALLQRRRRAVG
jgi:sulfate/thiosulfate transport system permease protein